MSHTLHSRSLLEFGLAQTADLLAQAFADYFVALPHSVATLTGLARQDSVDLAASRVWFCDGAPAAVLLHAARGTSARLAGMGVIPAARRCGVGRAAVEHWIETCQAQAYQSLNLEFIGANTPALALYARCGFQRVQRLAGWTLAATAAAPVSTVPLRRVDPRAVGLLIASSANALALPWQISAESIAQLAPPWSAWSSDSASVVVSSLAASTVSVRGIFFSPEAGPAAVAPVLQSLVAAHPGHEWRAPAIFPESWAAAFVDAGWQPSPLDQWQMRRDLIASPE